MCNIYTQILKLQFVGRKNMRAQQPLHIVYEC